MLVLIHVKVIYSNFILKFYKIDIVNYLIIGDSGGPLYILDKIGDKTKFVNVGVVSYGSGCARNNTAG